MVEWLAELARGPGYLAGPAFIAVGIALFVQARKHRAALAFGLFLVLRGGYLLGTSITGLAMRSGAGFDTVAGIFYLSNPFMVAAEFAGLWFVANFPRPRGWLGDPRRGGVLILGLMVLSVAIAFVAPAWLLTYEPNPTSPYPGGARIEGYGPLYWIPALPTFTVWTVLLLHDFVRDRVPDARRSLFLVAFAFIVFRAFQVSRSFATDVRMAAGFQAPNAFLPTFVSDVCYGLLAIGIGVLLVRGWRSPLEHVRAGTRQMLWVVAPIAVLGFLLQLARLDRDPLGGRLVTFVFNASLVAFVAIVAWALLRGRLFDIDNKVRITIRASTVGAVFLGIFVIVTQVASGFFESTYGWAFGGLAAGAALVALHPIQRVAERVATAAVPPPPAPGGLAHPDRVAAYRRVLADAYGDGTVDKTERRMLDTTRDALGLSVEDAARIEADFVKTP